jgi:hypothetical protein
MHIRIKYGHWGLSFSMFLAACTNKPAELQPLPPVIETVAVYRALPDSLRHPCDEPAWVAADITTDVDLLGLLNQYRLSNACNAAKIMAIDQIYGHAETSTRATPTNAVAAP